MSDHDLLEELLNAGSDAPGEMPFERDENKTLLPLLEEINLIQDPGIRFFVRSVLLRVKQFWTIPSSFSGTHHPPDERGVGGNVLHTRRVVRIASLICDAQERSPAERDVMVAGALLHDVLKGGESDNPSYDPLHPYTVDALVRETRLEDESEVGVNKSNAAYLEEEYVQQILRLIRCHLGTWSPIPETIPITTLEWSLHIADVIASELHTVLDGDDPPKTRWK